MASHTKKDDNAIDPEKNQTHLNLSTPVPSRRLLMAIILVKVAAAMIVIRNREVIDDVHQVLNSVLLSVLSAGLAQCILQFFRPVNYEKIIKFVIWGGINGLLTAYWIDFLFFRVELFPQRVLMDQLIATPAFQAIFITYNCIWENHDLIATLRKVFPRTLGLSYVVWPISSIVSFGFLPQHLIFPFTCFVNLIWTVILGLLT